MLKKAFGIIFIIIALIILIAVIYQAPKAINTAFIRIDNLDFLFDNYITYPIIALIIAFISIRFLLKLGIKWIKN